MQNHLLMETNEAFVEPRKTFVREASFVVPSTLIVPPTGSVS